MVWKVRVRWCSATGEGKTDPLYYPCPYARDMPLDDLVPRCAQHQRAPRVYRRKQRIAVLEAMFEVGEGFAQLVDEPVEFAFLWRRARSDQHPRCIHYFGHLESHARVKRRGAT